MASTTTTGQARDPFIYIQFKDTLQTQPASLVERYIKRYGIDVNRVFADGDTPAHVAAERGEDSILKVLGKHGVRIDKEGKDGLSPMQRAALRGQERAVRELCRLGEDVAHRCKPDQYSPLMYALGAMHGSCAEALLSLGAASIEKSEGYTARAIAILTGFHEMITKLDLEDFSNEFVFRKSDRAFLCFKR
jgi:ankyrin repeat protein